MFVSEFMKKMDMTKDTVRYYIEEGLLFPKKLPNGYYFSQQECDDFKSILELKKIGFRIAMIKELQAARSNGCGTNEHWLISQKLVTDELEKTKNELHVLHEREKELTKLQKKLTSLLTTE